MEEKKRLGGISAFTLHILAMVFMLSDHLWATLIPGQNWMTWLGRLAFPIYAFCIAEGYCHTKNFKKYMLRLLTAALISEIPFNLMFAASWVFPFQQNVLWTFLIALLCIRGLERLKNRWKPWLAVPAGILLIAACALAAMLTMTDYGAYGVLTVVAFYLFRGRKWYHLLLQAAAMAYINCVLMSGLNLPVTIGTWHFDFPQQGFAVLALLPIWCYRGKQGPHNKAIRYILYAFYPIHLLVLGLLSM